LNQACEGKGEDAAGWDGTVRGTGKIEETKIRRDEKLKIRRDKETKRQRDEETNGRTEEQKDGISGEGEERTNRRTEK
jgi:hypothetical protein